MDEKEKRDIAPVSEKRKDAASFSAQRKKSDYAVSRDIVQGVAQKRCSVDFDHRFGNRICNGTKPFSEACCQY